MRVKVDPAKLSVVSHIDPDMIRIGKLDGADVNGVHMERMGCQFIPAILAQRSETGETYLVLRRDGTPAFMDALGIAP